MAKFQFRFDAVLRQRQAAEDESQRDLARRLRERMILQTQLQAMQQSIIESKRSLADGLSGTVDLDRVSQFARYSGQESERARQIVVRMASLERQTNDARARLLQITRARKTMELLCQRHRDRWRLEEQRREANEHDEIATQQFLRTVNVEVAT